MSKSKKKDQVQTMTAHDTQLANPVLPPGTAGTETPSAATGTAVARTGGPSARMLALFAKAPAILDGLERKNLPPMIKPVEKDGAVNVPVGGFVSGIIVDVVKSPVSTVKGSLLWLALVADNGSGTLEKTGMEITFPATGVIRNALAPGVDGEPNALKEMLKHKGKLIVMQRHDDKTGRYGKAMTMWDIRLSKDDVAKQYGVKVN